MSAPTESEVAEFWMANDAMATARELLEARATLSAIDALTAPHPSVVVGNDWYGQRQARSDGYAEAMRLVQALLHPDSESDSLTAVVR